MNTPVIYIGFEDTAHSTHRFFFCSFYSTMLVKNDCVAQKPVWSSDQSGHPLTEQAQ